MQFHNKNNERAPQELKKNYMASSQFFPRYQYENQNSSIVQPIKSPTQKTESKQSAEKPAFLQNRKNNNIYRSMMFNLPQTQSPSKFQNPFLESKEIRGSVQEPSTKTIERQNMKQSFIPQQQLQNIENKITPRKFDSPKPLKSKQPNFLIKSLDELSNTNKPKECISKQVFSPIHPKKIIDFQAQSPGVTSLNKVFSDRKKEKELKSDEKTTLPLSQKSTKVPQFLKKNSPPNQSTKIPEIEQTKSSEGEIKLQKVSSQFGTQAPSNASMKKSMINSKFSGFKNYVQTQSFFSKKKQPQFSSSSFAKISNTPQNNTLKSEQTNFQFGRLSSPSALNHRRRIDSVHSKIITLSCFQLVDKIGKGAFGDVFIARQKLTGFLCVLKKVSKKKIKELKLQESIIRQIKIQSYLHHKHLTALYGFFADSEYLYLILEILPDGSMSQVKKNKKVPEVQVSRYLRQVCQGLRYMHKQEVIHRDLKPQNIFLYEDYLKIGDFGCAIYTQTLRKTVVGCLAYSSPEQLKNSLYDDKIDAWSVGILTYELLTGKSPFDNDLSKVFNNQMQLKDLKLQFPQDLNISEICKDFLLKLLALNPQERMSIDQTTKHPFITQLLKQDRKQELQVFSTYQSL